MLFNTVSYAIFLPVIFFLYWFVAKKQKPQNILLLVASYFFYACWDWRFLFLLIFSTLLDYFTAIKMSEASHKRRKQFWFWLSIGVNLGFLGVFKYYNFFVASFADMLSQMGFQANPWTLQVILPVGISFYTFHGLSYVIDVYKSRIKAERNFVDYSVFVSFFPLLVAGPIERATHLLPQIQQPRVFDRTKAVDGMKQILWGLFKKMVIADQCAGYVNTVFDAPSHYGGSSLAMAAVLFAFQIYGDFSGYSDIALGTAKLFGIDLLRNFAYPYFSRDIAEFWRRWHISLSSWFRDYLYVPLGGSRGGTWMKVRNTFIIFIVSGFWHGANWTFIAWGLLNAIYFLPLLLTNSNRAHLEIAAQGKIFPSLKEFLSIVATFALTVFAWIFFRANTISEAFVYIGGMFSSSLFSMPEVFPKPLLLMIVIFLIIEWLGRNHQYAIATTAVRQPAAVRWSFYYAVIAAIYLFGLHDSKLEFIYFQF